MKAILSASMWKLIFTVAILTAPENQDLRGADPVELKARTILIYENVSGGLPTPFVIRLGRAEPDIVLEWESRNHQGTLHMHRKAVESGRQLTLSELFEVGVDMETDQATTKWLSQEIFRELLEHGSAQVRLNRVRGELKLVGRASRVIEVDGEEVEVPVLLIQDSRRGTWVFLNNPRNPLLLEYASPHYREALKRVSNSDRNQLRWLRRLPPIR
ncbi:MAG TPA: hypothetical protein VMN76_01245 [Acidobacteriota bacterium]|nr:hypothetical protein [Acidobacteriota bacterium]